MYIRSGQKATMANDQCCICLGEQYSLYYSFHFSRGLTNCKIKSWGGERIQRKREVICCLECACFGEVRASWQRKGRFRSQSVSGPGECLTLIYLWAWVPGRCQRRGMRGPWEQMLPPPSILSSSQPVSSGLVQSFVCLSISPWSILEAKVSPSLQAFIQTCRT